MPKKKKTGGKKKGGKKGLKTVLSTFEYDMPDVAELGVQQVRYVSLTVKMVELVHLNFEWELVPTLVTIASIKDSIRARHGGTVQEVLLYKNLVAPHNLISSDNSATLTEVGIEGVSQGEELPKITLFYDFPPLEVDCPLLNDPPYEVEPRFLEPEIPVGPAVKHQAGKYSTGKGSVLGISLGTPARG
ncbi:hypothetical protein CYMTET_56341 [Cymbomonas tetramitiformis]|uniref:Uncharacterized protein n=1 Tax=Cymbomonas tetramitiformis TaxID=36881 RepID=A0AAE0BCW7_9CHLO|nr:hypothetical protein CYMTET_56341 [Cymbomonas tetramitiformis]